MKKITLTQGKVAIVDDEDYTFLNQWKWCADKSRNTFYAVRSCYKTGKKVKILMHRLISKVTDPLIIIDHKDHDGLNNQKNNLRAGTSKQNSRNSRPIIGKSSSYKGVAWNKHSKKWQAYIKVNNSCKHLGYFNDEKEAAEVYNEASVKYFGDFGNLNIL